MKPEQANFRRYQLQVWLQKIGKREKREERDVPSFGHGFGRLK